jgi:Tfp pilus assembly protein PilX
MLIRWRREEEGIALVVSLMVAFVVMLLATVIFSQAVHNSDRSAYGRNRLTAVSTAEAGLNYWYNYLQTTSPSSLTTSAINGTVGSSPATGTFSATPTFYADASGTTAFTGSISSSNFPLSAKIKSTGTANGITRTMESFITLRPIYAGFQGALIANNSTTFTNSFTVNGNAGNDADVYVLGTGAVFNAPSGLESIHGNVYVPAGSVNSIGTNVHIYGQVWANGSVLVNHPQAQIDGNVSSTTSSVTVSSGNVAGNAYYCTGSAPANVTGTKTSTCALGTPPTQSFPQVTYVQSAWASSGYTNFQNFTGASACTNAQAYVESTGAYAATGFSGHNVGNTVVRITQACQYTNSNNATITMNNNLAIITDGEINLSQQSNWNGVSSLKDLFMISTWPASTCPASGAAGSHDVSFGNLTQTNSLVETFVYTPCTATMLNNNSAFTGQVIGSSLSVGNNFQENYKPILVPGANLTGYNQDIAYIREVS